jgi:cytidylate kinase
MKHPIVIAVDGTSASGKSSTSRALAKMLGFVYVDTGAMYRTLAWHCLKLKVDVANEKAVAGACRKWSTSLECSEHKVHLLVEGCNGKPPRQNGSHARQELRCCIGRYA